MKRWYVVSTHARGEDKALFHLRRQGFEAYLPRYRKRRRHARRIDHVPAPLFPRYLFVRLDLKADLWRPVRSTVGVSHIVCQNERPAPVPEGIVEDIRSREAADGMVALNTESAFKRGEKVQILDGALIDQVGLFDSMADDERVVVLLKLLGREVKVRLPLDTVQAYA